MNTALVYSPDLDFALPDFAALGVAPEDAGTSNIYSFDGSRSSRAYNAFQKAHPEAEFELIVPVTATEEELLLALDPDYLASLRDPELSNTIIGKIIDIPSVAAAPPGFMEQVLLGPKRLATGGTLGAMRWVLSRDPGGPTPVAVNLGGGYHHAHHDCGEGFCVYNDIAIAAAAAEKEFGLERILCVDVDAHQGNGTATMFGGNEKRGLLDFFNKDIWPGDQEALALTRWPVPLADGTTGEAYLKILAERLDSTIAEFAPDLIIYNAGTDTLDGDPLGRFHISLPEIAKRDALVLDAAAKCGAPLIAVPSGGYTDQSHLALAGLLDVATSPRTL